MQKMTGNVGTVIHSGPSGVFSAAQETIKVSYGGTQNHALAKADFDNSRTVRTATETRVSNTALAPRLIAF